MAQQPTARSDSSSSLPRGGSSERSLAVERRSQFYRYLSEFGSRPPKASRNKEHGADMVNSEHVLKPLILDHLQFTVLSRASRVRQSHGRCEAEKQNEETCGVCHTIVPTPRHCLCAD